jgi:hypothetical protein
MVAIHSNGHIGDPQLLSLLNLQSRIVLTTEQDEPGFWWFDARKSLLSFRYLSLPFTCSPDGSVVAR